MLCIIHLAVLSLFVTIHVDIFAILPFKHAASYKSLLQFILTVVATQLVVCKRNRKRQRGTNIKLANLDKIFDMLICLYISHSINP